MFDTTFLVRKLKLFYIPFQMDKCSRPMCFFTKQKVSSNCGKQLCYFHLFGRHVTHKTLYQIQSSVLQLKLQVFWDCQKTKTLEEKNLGEMFVVPKDFLRGIAFVFCLLRVVFCFLDLEAFIGYRAETRITKKLEENPKTEKSQEKPCTKRFVLSRSFPRPQTLNRCENNDRRIDELSLFRHHKKNEAKLYSRSI